MAEIDWNQFSKEELVRILEAMDQQSWLVERFDTHSEHYMGQTCSCDVEPLEIPEPILSIKHSAAARIGGCEPSRSSAAAAGLEQRLRKPPAATTKRRGGGQRHGEHRPRESRNSIAQLNLYLRIRRAAATNKEELPAAVVSVLKGHDRTPQTIEDAEIDLTQILDLDNLEHLDIIHDFREAFPTDISAGKRSAAG